jgi:riboflavin synthase
VARVWRGGDALRLSIHAPASARGMVLGGSVAVDGVCLTAIEVKGPVFAVQVVTETVRRSNLGGVRTSRRVNLERPLKAFAELGGHFVQGHVDAAAPVAGLKRLAKDVVLAVELPASLKRLVVTKGSIAVNGVSLTVASVARRVFTVALIPHTLENTNLGGLRAGDLVNLEADILGKYVQAMISKSR